MRIRIPKDKKIGVVIGGYAAGKSYSGLEWIREQAWPNGCANCLVIRRKWETMRHSTYHQWITHFASEPVVSVRPGVWFSYGNARVIFGALFENGKDRRDQLKSYNFDTIFVDEAVEFSHDDFILLHHRLRSTTKEPQILLACNAKIPEWLLSYINSGDAHLIAMNQEDNPLLYDGDNKNWTASGKDYRRRLLEGTFADAD
jgi:phage terminase large subunit